MPKHETAFYQDENNIWHEVNHNELFQKQKRAELRERDLYDKPDGDLQLGIRNHKITPHFYVKRPIRKSLEYKSKKSKLHNEQIDIIYNFLKKYKKHSFNSYKSFNFTEETIIKIKNYEWEKEAKFGIIYGKYAVFDILGRDYENIHLTDKNPFVAIEVIDTHFHSQETFKILLEATKNLPLIIIYFFINQIPKLNHLKKPKNENFYTRNVIYFHMSDGSFWEKNERIEEKYEKYNLSPNNSDQYYNFIKEKLYEKKFIKSTSSEQGT